MNKHKGTLKKCPSCGKFFTCKGEEDCWCEKVRIHSAEMKMIMNTYSDCLCPECLKKFEKE
jgi:ribosomal protein L34E